MVISYDPHRPSLRPFAALRSGFLDGSDSPRDFLERCLEVVDAREPQLQAFVVLDVDRARRVADDATARYRAGAPWSRLDGCPVGVKDIIETEDMPTQMGSPHFEGWRSGRDAACVLALRQAGAIILGKTHTTEFACGGSAPSTNPHDPARTPGGSSSGSAAAVGAGAIPVGLGTQTAGSILRPAAYCGAYGYKPSHGILPTAGIHPISRTLDHLGSITGSLADGWAAARVMADSFGGNAWAPRLPGSAKLPTARKPVRLAMLETEGWPETDAATRGAIGQLADWLRGWEVEILTRETDPLVGALETELVGANAVNLALMTHEMRYPMLVYRQRDETRLGDRIREYLADGDGMSVDDYVRALEARRRLREAWARLAERADAAVTLASSGPAPIGLEETGSRAFLSPASVAGHPALSLPLLSVDGLPQGVQLIGYPGRDHDLFAAARWLTETWLADPSD